MATMKGKRAAAAVPNEATRAVTATMKGRDLVTEIETRRVVRVPLAELGIAAAPRITRVEVDEDGAILLHRADGSVEDLGADHVLHVTAPEYDARGDAQYRRDLAQRVGERIRVRRLERGMPAARVAEALGMAPSHYSRLEAGTHLPSMDKVVMAAKVLGCTLGELVAAPASRGRGARVA